MTTRWAGWVIWGERSRCHLVNYWEYCFIGEHYWVFSFIIGSEILQRTDALWFLGSLGEDVLFLVFSSTNNYTGHDERYREVR